MSRYLDAGPYLQDVVSESNRCKNIVAIIDSISYTIGWLCYFVCLSSSITYESPVYLVNNGGVQPFLSLCGKNPNTM